MFSDARFDALCAWLERALPAPIESIAPASADASFRRYFRITLQTPTALPGAGSRVRTLIAMDAPPPQEDCRPFVAVAALLSAAGVHAPAVVAAVPKAFCCSAISAREPISRSCRGRAPDFDASAALIATRPTGLRLRRSVAPARTELFPPVVRRQASGHSGTAHKPLRWRERSSASSATISRSPGYLCIATITREI